MIKLNLLLYTPLRDRGNSWSSVSLQATYESKQWIGQINLSLVFYLSLIFMECQRKDFYTASQLEIITRMTF